jgi:hypothetical protein
MSSPLHTWALERNAGADRREVLGTIAAWALIAFAVFLFAVAYLAG